MSRKEKYYLTTLNKHLPKAGEKWGSKYSYKFIIGCKATSMGEANKIALKLGLDKNTFKSANIMFGNVADFKMIDKLGFVIRPYVSYEIEAVDIRDVL